MIICKTEYTVGVVLLLEYHSPKKSLCAELVWSACVCYPMSWVWCSSARLLQLLQMPSSGGRGWMNMGHRVCSPQWTSKSGHVINYKREWRKKSQLYLRKGRKEELFGTMTAVPLVCYTSLSSFTVANGGLDVTNRTILLDSVRLYVGKKGFSAKVKLQNQSSSICVIICSSNL